MVKKEKLDYFSLNKLCQEQEINLATLPFTIKILLENLVRNFDDKHVKISDINNLLSYKKISADNKEISFFPCRVLMQDFTGVPAIVDLASMRDAALEMGIDPERINPLIPVDLVV